jgi:hypothetical protein
MLYPFNTSLVEILVLFFYFSSRSRQSTCFGVSIILLMTHPVHLLPSSSYRVVFKLFRYLLSHILDTLSNKFLLLFIYAFITFFFFCFVSDFLNIFALHSSKIFKPILFLLYEFLFPRTVCCSSCNLTPRILFQATFLILY